ncbi:NCS1 nucleoside transporter family [Tamaricihabitans halophyticus]|uniref:NCS1 nucleoside transporter family n=1 Tax=Tamaricihabitans halophyticus TaxID=1262583 RepID=A0A4V2SUL8_9PSEU|nr:cytosine permease [Tamaricihabitans halophyticus]TCP55036.1 NCS1 nucleoside transporter family [Tamaricihabitans halophyticus]
MENGTGDGAGARSTGAPRPTYRQPKGVEQYGVEPVPASARTVRWLDLFQIIVNVLLNPGLILVGGLAVVSGLSFWAAVSAQVLGIAIAFIAYTIMSTIGVDYGLPGIVATRATLGIRASKWLLSALRSVASAFWFAFQTIAGALGITAVLEVWLGVDVSVILVSVIFAVLQAVVALFGYRSLKHLSRVAFPLKIVILGYLGYLLATHDAPGFSPAEVFSYSGEGNGWQWAIFAVWTNATAATWFTQITDAADYCRYTSSRKDMWLGTMGAALLGATVSACFGAYAAAATLGTQANPFEVIPGLGVGAITLFLVLVVLVLDNWTINVLNLYTGGLALVNMIPRAGRFWATVLIAIAGTALAAVPSVVDNFEGYMTALGNVFAPVVGVLVADYLVVKRARLEVPALFEPAGRYWYVAGVNPIALGWILLGAAAYGFVPEELLPTPSIAVLSGIGYWLTTTLAARHWPAIREATARAEVPPRPEDTVAR